MGFKLKRPDNLAVGSPKISAIVPWAISCNIAENNKMMIMIISPGSIKGLAKSIFFYYDNNVIN